MTEYSKINKPKGLRRQKDAFVFTTKQNILIGQTPSQESVKSHCHRNEIGLLNSSLGATNELAY